MTSAELSFSPFFHPVAGLGALRSLFDAVEGASNPPYDIEQLGADSYRISLAVPGFKPDALAVEAKGNTLSVRARHAEEANNGKAADYLYRGIRRGNFNWSFDLAEHIRVKGAEVKDGLLHIHLVREVPEAEKPQRIEVKAA